MGLATVRRKEGVGERGKGKGIPSQKKGRKREKNMIFFKKE